MKHIKALELSEVDRLKLEKDYLIMDLLITIVFDVKCQQYIPG